MLKRLLCCLFLPIVVGVSWSYAQQTPTTQGKEFWVSFMRNGYRIDNPGQLILIATAKHACTVTVTNPNKSWSQPFQVPENNVASVIIPDAQGYNDQIGATGDINKGLYVTADDTISLYIANDCRNSYDAANVLPVQALGCRYMVQTNQSLAYSGSHSDDNRASFLVVATENNTQVQITPSCQTMDNHSDTYTVTLQRGQCYHVMSMAAGNPGNTQGDFSGTWIESLENKPIAVFSGNCVTAVTDVAVSEGLDHVFEQAMPVDNWGKQFVVTRTMASQTLQADRVKITALLDGTDVMRNGDLVYRNLSAGESRTFWLSETSSYLESSKPVAVYLYNHSHSSSNTFGDPSMVWISPVEQTLQDVIFSTFSSDNTTLTHFVNVVCYTADAAELYLNGSPIPQSQIETVNGAPQFSFARVSARSGMNRLHCPGGLVAHVYGMGDRQGYAYTVGSSAKMLTTQLFINGESYDNYPDGYTTCQNHENEFSVEANFDIDHVIWHFTDGYSDTGETISRSFGDDGTFEVEVYVYHDEEVYEHMLAVIHVSPMIEIPVNYSTCASTYHFHGQDFPVPYFEDFIIHSEEGCDTIYHMNIQSNPSVSAPLLYETICEEDEGYLWFDTLRTEPGTYLVIAQSPAGCDSVCLLHLEVDKVPENPEREMFSCTPYHWGADIVCDHTDDYHRTFLTQEGLCEYDSVLHFTLLVSPLFEQIVGLSNVAVATNFWPGQYLYYLDDSTGIATERVRWELMGNPEGAGHWELIPRGASCTVIAYSMGERVLWVSTGDGPCDREAFKTINCTGYGVDENEMVNLEIYPNPAKDELVVKGPEMQELTIYNLLGQKMCSVSANGGAEVKLEVGGLPQALYLLEVRTPRGNKTRLVSVIN